jgi:predicted N-formylglutamate amidohydrolase
MSGEVEGLLGADDPPPWSAVLPHSPAMPVLLVCDHAGAAVPSRLDGLGLAPLVFDNHIAIDIGAGSVTGRLAQLLEVPAVLCTYSRLVVDCNRHLDDPTAFATSSDGIPVPGNVGLTAGDRRTRSDQIYWPYHEAVTSHLRQLAALAPALVSVHTFTPELAGHVRPWHVGVLWDADPRLAQPLLKALQGEPGLVVGDNQPYSGRSPVGFTMGHHAAARGLPHVSIEIRQDLVGDAPGQQSWAALLARVLHPILATPELYRPWPAASRPVAPDVARFRSSE